MLVIPEAGVLTLVTQIDHAHLAGVLAEHWGNERFAVPAPRPAFLCAAAHHDDGWFELDGRPFFNPRAQRPSHFTEIPLDQSAGPYGRGVESVYARDPLAGALVSMHWSGFSTSRWGAGGGPPSENPLALEIVARQESRWMPALREAWGYRGRRSEFDAHAWHAYEVLQAVDLLSLGLALLELDPASAEREPTRVEDVLGRVQRADGPLAVTAVPQAAGTAAPTTLIVRPLGDARVELDPHPLDIPELEIVLPAREIEDRRYESEQSAARAYHAAPVEQRRITVVAPAGDYSA